MFRRTQTVYGGQQGIRSCPNRDSKKEGLRPSLRYTGTGRESRRNSENYDVGALQEDLSGEQDRLEKSNRTRKRITISY